MVQQAAVAVGRVLQLFEEVRNQTDVVAGDLGEVGDLGRRLAVMRSRVERNLHAAFRVNALADVATHLEGGDAGGVGGEGQRLKIEHQLDVIFERVRHTDGS